MILGNAPNQTHSKLYLSSIAQGKLTKWRFLRTANAWPRQIGITACACGTRPRVHKERVSTVTFSPDGKLLATASWDDTVRLWEAATGKEIRTLPHKSHVLSVAFSPDAKRLVSAGWDVAMRLWDVDTGKEIRSLTGHQDTVLCVAFSPDGKQLVTGSLMPDDGSPVRDDSVRLWNVATGKEIRTLKGHKVSVCSVAYSPDGKRVASAGHDQTVRLWEVATGREALTIKQHKFVVSSVAFSPDGKRMYPHAGRNWRMRMRLRDMRPSASWPPHRGNQCRFWPGVCNRRLLPTCGNCHGCWPTSTVSNSPFGSRPLRIWKSWATRPYPH
jgi:WD40 repeat protein